MTKQDDREMAEADEIMTMERVAERLHVCRKALQRIIQDHPYYRQVGRRKIFTEVDFQSAKSICLNFGIAQEFAGGKCNLRFDDTNPIKEEEEYVESIKRDVRWLGFDWEDRLFFGSDYFEQMYEWAEQLIQLGKAYVCDLPLEEVRSGRGTLTKPGTDSPYRDRSIEENLILFRRIPVTRDITKSIGVGSSDMNVAISSVPMLN